MATQTPNLDLTKPAVGADDDVWGGMLNGNWDKLDDVVQTALDGAVPAGAISIWYSTIATIPDGYGFCDGTIYSREDGNGSITSPDLRSRLIVGATGDGTGNNPQGGTGDYDGSGGGADYINMAFIMKL